VSPEGTLYVTTGMSSDMDIVTKGWTRSSDEATTVFPQTLSSADAASCASVLERYSDFYGKVETCSGPCAGNDALGEGKGRVIDGCPCRARLGDSCCADEGGTGYSCNQEGRWALFYDYPCGGYVVPEGGTGPQPGVDFQVIQCGN
jgi:hypothetical protein